MSQWSGLLSDMYSDFGGLRWGSLNMSKANISWPFAILSVDRKQLEIRLSVFGIWTREYLFPWSKISNLRCEKGVVSTGLVVEHQVTEYPEVITFWTGSSLRLKAALYSFGYKVTE
jgi:hypothetical protein